MSQFLSKIHDKASKVKQKVHDEIDELQSDISRLRVAVETTWNPKFKSFSVPREGNDVKWYIDGHDYFWALSEILERAHETIWIMDWWLSPELYLRRPPALHEEYRLDRILKRKAEQGVKIFVIVYKEVNTTMTMNSKYTKHALEELHRNIACIRHPDHSGGEIVMYWSHHEKIVVVDSAIACIGGLDICYGRWDTHNFPLADVHPDNVRQTLFPGQDYNDARVADFENVQAWAGNNQARTELGRMPWHDLHTMMVGPVVVDIAQHFIERWNYVTQKKYRHQSRYPLLDWPVDDPLEHRLAQHPHTSHLRQFGSRYKPHMVHFEDRPVSANMRVQVVRSVGDWSMGFLTEHSIQNAYIELIKHAEHFIYIENQFFISWPSQKGLVRNGIAAAIVERILRAAREGRKFKVMVCIPEVPCFAGDLIASSGTLAILDATYRSLCRGKDSIFGLIQAAGYDPKDYIGVFHLRQYDRIKYDPKIFEEIERASGVTWPQVQAAIARLHIGEVNVPELEQTNNQTIRFRPMKYSDEIVTAEPKKGQKCEELTQVLSLPETVREAEDIVARYQNAVPSKFREVPASIARNTLQSHRSVVDEPWHGSEAAEKGSFVSEELYIHSKMMCIDDRTVIIGSANLNERSQAGDRDSEIAIVIEDQDFVESYMNGQPYPVARFATTFRRQIFRGHLGLIPPQDCNGYIDAAMRPVGLPPGPNEYDFNSEEDYHVMDPLSESFETYWNDVAATNSAIYAELFHHTPSQGIRNWEQYKQWVSTYKKVGHIANQDALDIGHIKSQLSKIRGHLVTMPTDFLEDIAMLELTAQVNPITMPIFM